MKTAALRDDRESVEPAWVELIRSHVKTMRFGVVQIVVHDSRVVQIERTEKLRLDRPEAEASFSGCIHNAGPSATRSSS